MSLINFLIDGFSRPSELPIEVKSGKDYTQHSALNHFLAVEDYGIDRAVVLSNERVVRRVGNVLFLPIYYVMFFHSRPAVAPESLILPELDMPSL